MAAIATWRTGGLARWGGALLAAGLVLYIPPFYGPAPALITHSLLLAAGCLWFAVSMWSRPRPQLAQAGHVPMSVSAGRSAD